MGQMTQSEVLEVCRDVNENRRGIKAVQELSNGEGLSHERVKVSSDGRIIPHELDDLIKSGGFSLGHIRDGGVTLYRIRRDPLNIGE